jgi:phage terminase large subunit-like protein
MALIEEVWSNLLFGLRLGRQPRICCTTTPLPSQWIKDLVKSSDTISVVASTYTNLHNLAPQFAQVILSRYEGTRKGRQEIHGEILADVEGALWKYDMLHNLLGVDPLDLVPHMERIVVAIDPAGTQRKKSDETGIVVIGVLNEHYYVLHDASGKYSPAGWATRAVQLVDAYSADYLVVETNYGGDMVRTTLESVDENPRIEEVNSRRGKVIRADPIVALYEKGRVHHVGANLGELEDQLVGWVPGTDSPDRLDALVHGITDLARTVDPASVASPSELRALAGGLQGPGMDPRAHLSLVRTA